MAFELIVNLLLLAFSVVCFIYVGATMPKSAVNELGAEQWPQAIIIILVLALLWNIYKLIRDHKDELGTSFGQLGKDTVNFFKSKLFIGMLLVLIMSLLYEPIGFMTTCLLFLIAYGILLGERRPLRLLISSVIITVILYIGFSVFLGVLLPRGNVGFLRNFALFVESLIPRF